MTSQQRKNLTLLHGWGFNSLIWASNIPHLNSKFDITKIDLNGHGNQLYSPKYEDIDFYLDDLITSIPENSDILGWSLGGIIALKLKNKYPDKINNIILCCSTPCFISNPSWAYGVAPSVWEKFSGELLTNKERAIKDFLLLQTMNLPNAKILFQELTEIMYQSPPHDINGLQWGLNILKQDHRDLLNQTNNSQIKCIFGAKDLLINKNIQSWFAEKHPAIQTVMLVNSGHMPFITEPELFYDYLE